MKVSVLLFSGLASPVKEMWIAEVKEKPLTSAEFRSGDLISGRQKSWVQIPSRSREAKFLKKKPGDCTSDVFTLAL